MKTISQSLLNQACCDYDLNMETVQSAANRANNLEHFYQLLEEEVKQLS
tara:strand:+ start:55908 stop:56054 length:147 start_codon:yes stop_codon:yes gene_type:complete